MLRLANHGASPFFGWKRATVDVPELWAADAYQWEDGTVAVMGGEIAPGLQVVDVHCKLAPGARLELNPATAAETTHEVQPPDSLQWTGGPLRLNGQEMQWVGLQADGAAWCAHLRGRTGRTVVVDVWVRRYPGNPYAEAEALITSSHPGNPDMAETIGSLHITFGSAMTLPMGRPAAHSILPVGTRLADGQGKYVPLVFLWLDRLGDDIAQDLSNTSAAITGAVGACGILELWQGGNPAPRPIGVAREWSRSKFSEAVRRLHTWDAPVCGPAIRSSDTGAQEDQLFHPGSEAQALAGAEWVRLLSACKLHAERPCNHKEVDGSPLDLDRHPGLLMWDGRPYPPVTQDMLGKPRALSASEARGRWGPDTQHFLAQSLLASARLTGSHAAQQLLSNLATVMLAQRTSTRGWSTSATFSAREWGYEGLFITECQRTLEDRGLAERLATRWQERVDRILLEDVGERDYLYAFTDDARLGPGKWAIAWQEALASYGIDIACEAVPGCEKGRQVARRIAERILRDGYELTESGSVLSRAQFPVDGQPLPEPDGSFNHFGLPLAVATVLRHDPDNEKARAIAEYLEDTGSYKWIAPGVFR